MDFSRFNLRWQETQANLETVIFTLGVRVKERVAGSLTAVWVVSRNTLAAQVGSDTLLLLPKTMNLNLILRLLSSGPDWHALAVVAYRLASRAPPELKEEPSGAGNGTNPSGSGQRNGKAFEVPEAHL